MQFKKLFFENKLGQKLAARLDLPSDGRPIAYALFAHCFTCSKNIKAAHHISSSLTEQRIAVFRFDFTGLGESEGDFADTNFSSNVDDLIDASEFLRYKYQAPQILIGHSLGGTAILLAASQITSSKAVVTIGSPSKPNHVALHLGSAREKIETTGEAEFRLGGKTFNIKKQFLDDLESTHILGVVRNLKKALLILHSPIDNIVGIENAAQVFQVARHPKSFVSLDRADHLLSDQVDSTYVGLLIATWVRRYIDVPERVTS